MAVDLGERERAVGARGGEVRGPIENGEQVEDGGEEAEDHLDADRLGEILTRTGDFFGQVRDAVGCSHGEGAVDHAGQEYEEVVRVARLIVPAAPHRSAGRVRGAVDMRHGRTDDDGDQDPGDDEENAQSFQYGEQSIREQHCRTRYPCANEITHQNVPFLHDKICMEGCIHGHGLVSHHGRHGGHAGNPPQTIPPSCKPATWTSISSGGEGRPVINCYPISLKISGHSAQAEDKPPLDDGMADASSAMEAATKK